MTIGYMNKTTLGITASAMLFCALLHAESLQPEYDLRVYGRLKAEQVATPEGEGATIRLTAIDRAHAELLLSKFVADFTTLPTVRADEINVKGTRLTLLRYDSGRCLLPVLADKSTAVDLRFFDSDAKLKAFIEKADLKGAYRLQGRKHPFYLDRWDRHAMGFWYSAFGGSGSRPELSTEADFAFFRANDLSINANENFYGPALWCRRSSVGYKINRWFDVSNYAYDACPEAATCSDPDLSMIYDYYGEVPFAENPMEPMQNAEMLANLSQFTGDEHLESITLSHGETGPHDDEFYGFRDRDEYSRQDFIHYLRDLRKLTLPALGERWYGDAKRYQDWQQVQFPREREFYGWQDGASQSLAGTWRVRIATRAEGETQGVFKPDYADASWLDFQTGNQAVAGGRREGWVRRTFKLDEALAKALTDRKPVYLTVCPFNYAPYGNPATAYLNGTKLGDISFGHANEWAQYEVGAQLKADGENVVAVFSPKACVQGPVFLSLKKVEHFPTSDAGLNARQLDLREWVADCVARANLRYLEYLRGIDASRPVKIMAYDGMIDIMMPYSEQMGAYPHCTGESAFFRPWFKRYGYLRGIQDSSEPSQPCINVEQLRGLFFCQTMEGVNGHDYFIHLHCITGDPAQKAWYESNVNYFKLNGRFDLKKPAIALARSLKVDRAVMSNGGEDTIHQNDPGRGDIQESHNGYVFFTERDLRDGLVDSYPVIVDCNFHMMEDETVDLLTRWVERGGKLVLNQRSGRNSFLKANTWPIARLTGCSYEIRPQEGNVIFEKDPPMLKRYAGQSFVNKDDLYDWQKHRYFSDCVALTPKEKDVSVVARYDDGAAAIVTRSVGKGMVIVLGSSFFRNSHDISGYFVPTHEQTVFYKTLFKDLGVAPLIESDEDKLWAERFVANNGSTEMLVLGNKNPSAPLVDVSATWDLGFAPKRVFDPVTGLTLPVVIDGSRVTISHLTLASLEMRYFAVERVEQDAAGMIGHWLFRQRQMWRAVPQGRPVPSMHPSWPIFATGDFQVKQFDKEADARAALAADYKTDGTWRSMLRSDWASAGLQQGKNLWAVYRKTIEVTPAWLDGLRGVQVQWENFGFGGSIREMAINGLVIMNGESPVNNEKILEVLKPGPNLLTIICAGRNDGNGGFTASFCLRRIPGAGGETMDLSKGWTIYTTDAQQVAADFPWEGTRLMARKKVVIPAKYKGWDVWLEAGGDSSVVAVNGRMRYDSNNYGRKFGTFRPLRVNIAPDIRYGEENDIWLGGGNWHDGLRPLPGKYESAQLIFTPKPKWGEPETKKGGE